MYRSLQASLISPATARADIWRLKWVSTYSTTFFRSQPKFSDWPTPAWMTPSLMAMNTSPSWMGMWVS